MTKVLYLHVGEFTHLVKLLVSDEKEAKLFLATNPTFDVLEPRSKVH